MSTEETFQPQNQHWQDANNIYIVLVQLCVYNMHSDSCLTKILTTLIGELKLIMYKENTSEIFFYRGGDSNSDIRDYKC